MKKTVIALAVAGFSFNASAVTLSNVTGGGVVAPTAYASEIKFPQELENAVKTGATGLNIGFKFGFSASEGVKRYVRIDLTNAEFVTGSLAAAAPLVGVSGTTIGALTAAVDQKISNGGEGQNYVIVEVSPKTGSSIANSDVLALVVNKINALSADGVTAQYRLYETATAAFEGTDVTLASASGTLFTTKSGVVAKFTAGDDKKIDVGEDSKFFTNALGASTKDTTKELANFTFAPVADVKAIAGADITLADLYNTATLALNGSFAAVKDAGDAAPNKDNFTLDTAKADSLTAAKATFNVLAGIDNKALAYTVDGDTVLDIDTITGEVQVTAKDATKYNVANLPLDNILVEKNGGSDIVNLVMKPGANYRHFVRITNKDAQAGRFFVTLFNDAGDSASVRLDAVNLGTAEAPEFLPASIAGGASTKQILIDKIYDAVVAANPSFAVTGENKLRVQVSGEVSDVSVQSYVVSTNNNALVKFN